MMTRNERGFFLLALITFAIFITYRCFLIFYPQTDIGGVEVNIIYFVQRLLDHQHLYADPSSAAYSIGQYSPLYYYLVAGVARLFGTGPDDVLQLFIISRITSLILNFMLMYIVILICRNIFSLDRARSFITGIFSFVFLEITSFSRPDSLNHVLFLLSLYLFLLCLKKKNGVTLDFRFLFASSVIAAVALFAKQSSVVLPILFGGWLLYKQSIRSLMIFVEGYLVTVSCFLLIIQYSTGLDLLYKNAILGIANGISIGWFRMIIIGEFYERWGIIYLPMAVLTWIELRKQPGMIAGFLKYCFAAIFIFFNIIGLKNGSVTGYFTEWWIVLFILVAAYWQAVIKIFQNLNALIPGALLSLALMINTLLIVWPAYTMMATSKEKRFVQYNSEEQIAQTILGKLEPGENYTIFANFYTPESFLSCFLFRHLVLPQTEIVTMAAYPKKMYDYSDLLTSLKDGRIKWLIMSKRNKDLHFFTIPLDQYQWQQDLGPYSLYKYHE